MSRRIVFAISVLLTAGAGGCAPAPPEVAFNDAISNASVDVSDAGQRFANAVNLALASDPNDTGVLAVLRLERENALEVMKGVMDDMDRLSVPDEPAARKLFDHYQRFIKAQHEMIDEDFAEILAILGDESLAPPRRHSKVTVVYNKMATEENRRMRRLQQVQKDFAREHNMVLVSP